MNSDSKPISVSELTEIIKGVIDVAFPRVWLVGEISNYSRPAGGHHYFTLKDQGAVLPCAFFRGHNLRLRFDPKPGMSVVARGAISVYLSQGRYQLIVEDLQPLGVGSAELALQQLKEKLLKQGYFKPDRKRPLPHYPRRVGIVTSSSGAALRDMLESTHKRWPGLEIILKHSRVQGDSASTELAEGVRLLSTLHASGALILDAIIVARGGGSSEDLAAFQDEGLADAIFAASVPVISAVGHETDVSIADLVADARAITPTASIEMLTPDRGELLEDLVHWERQLINAVIGKIEMLKERVTNIAARPVFRKPEAKFNERYQRLDDLAERLRRAWEIRWTKADTLTKSLATQLESLSPLNTLKRGYSLTMKDARVVTRATDVSPGQTITTRLNEGTITSTVIATS